MTARSTAVRLCWRMSPLVCSILGIAVDALAQPGRFTQSPTQAGERRSLSSTIPSDISGLGPIYVFGGPGTVTGKFQTSLAPGSPADAQGWTGVDLSGAGDFSRFFSGMSDTDNCASNPSGVAGFHSNVETSPNWSYGVPGGLVVPYSLATPIHNEIQSPVIVWDLPGTADDNNTYVGARLSFRVWKHLPVENGIAYYWAIRVRSGADPWSTWLNDGLLEYGGDQGVWIQESHDFGHMIDWSNTPNPSIQIALGVIDVSGTLGLPGADATLSPVFDDVSIEKYEVHGPTIRAWHIDMFQDSFAQSGATILNSLDDHDVRIDSGRDLDPTSAIVPQDGLLAEVVSSVLGVAITDPENQIRLNYNLNMNPVFGSGIRGNAPTTSLGSGLNGWDQSQGSVFATYTAVPNVYSFDLPDIDFMYPGDVLEYYIEAEDDGGTTTTLPSDLSGFDNPPTEFRAPEFVMRALPSYADAAGSHPPRLLVLQNGHRGQYDTYRTAFWNAGYHLYEDVDVYMTLAPEFVEPNSLGSSGAHGATAPQLLGYSKIIYVAGNLDRNVLSYGGATNVYETDAADIPLLSLWRAQADDRAITYFGDDIAAVPSSYTNGALYVSAVMKVTYNNDSTPVTTQQPCIVPDKLGVSLSFGVGPACPTNPDFDQIGGTCVMHKFGGLFCIAGPETGSVLDDLIDGLGNRKVQWTFPFDLAAVVEPSALKIDAGNPTRAAQLLDEIMAFVGDSPPSSAVDAPPGARVPMFTVFPNPANPAFSFRIDAPEGGIAEIRIYDLRGQLVDELLSEELPPGVSTLQWSGKNARGDTAPSGVYVAKLTLGRHVMSEKLVLVK